MPLTILHLPPYAKSEGGPKMISPNDVIAFSMQKKKVCLVIVQLSNCICLYSNLFMVHIKIVKGKVRSHPSTFVW